ncbi:MAG: hypothetical protein ACRET5_12370 [Steroidobacteraceae bacterium]
MERESLLAILAILLGGAVLQPFALWPSRAPREKTAAELERWTWIRLWIPVVPALFVAAGLVGWALREPDPVRDPLDRGVLLAAWAPFGVIFARAALRAVWAVARRPMDCAVSTVGLIQPQVVFSPFLARQLDEEVIRAALAHERAHVLHRDPLRIWLAQWVTDLQWPWPGAMLRFERWLDALELARDDEARASGSDGADLAAAVLASMRFNSQLEPQDGACFNGTQLAHARLTGDSRALRNRVSRLLAPLTSRGKVQRLGTLQRAGYLLIPLLMAAVLLGVIYGERLVHPLLAVT